MGKWPFPEVVQMMWLGVEELIVPLHKTKKGRGIWVTLLEDPCGGDVASGLSVKFNGIGNRIDNLHHKSYPTIIEAHLFHNVL